MDTKQIVRQELDLLGQCLSLQSPQPDSRPLAAALRDFGIPKILDFAVQHRLEPSLALATRTRSLLPQIPKISLGDGRITITKSVDDILNAHHLRRGQMKNRLVEIVHALNQIGICPTLIKGARSLWTGTPEWRALRDLDLVIAGSDILRAQALLHQMGYTNLKRNYIDIGKHHLPELFRPDMPGWIELHRNIALGFAEQLLPTDRLVRRQHISILESGAKVGFLQITDHILQSLIHHHFHHHEFRNKGWLNIKGLYEFAADVTLLDELERQELLEKASTNPRLLAAFDLWLAAVSDLFACPILKPFAVLPDATRRWEKAKDRMTIGRRAYELFPGYIEELSLCFDQARLARVKTSKSPPSAAGLKLSVIISLLSGFYPTKIVLPRLWL